MVCSMCAKVRVAPMLVLFNRTSGYLDLSLFLWDIMYGTQTPELCPRVSRIMSCALV